MQKGQGCEVQQKTEDQIEAEGAYRSSTPEIGIKRAGDVWTRREWEYQRACNRYRLFHFNSSQYSDNGDISVQCHGSAMGWSALSIVAVLISLYCSKHAVWKWGTLWIRSLIHPPCCTICKLTQRHVVVGLRRTLYSLILLCPLARFLQYGWIEGLVSHLFLQWLRTKGRFIIIKKH